MQVHQRGSSTRKAFDAARVGLARRFGACCRRGSAEGFVIPVLSKLDRLTEFLDEFVSLAAAPWVKKKYDLVFESSPEAFRLHQSIVATLGVSNFHRFHTIVADVVDDIGTGRYPDIDCMGRIFWLMI